MATFKTMSFSQNTISWHPTSPCNCSVCLQWACTVSSGFSKSSGTSWFPKPTKRHVRPAKNQISLDIRPVWSESSLSAWRNSGSLASHWAHTEPSDQTVQMHMLILVLAGLVLSCCGSNTSYFCFIHFTWCFLFAFECDDLWFVTVLWNNTPAREITIP